jgi:hypothetical protein
MTPVKRTEYPFDLFERYSTIFIIPWIILTSGLVGIGLVIASILLFFDYYCKHC